MTPNPNPSPELCDPTCVCCCRPKSEHVRKQCQETTYFIENVSPQALPAPGEVENSTLAVIGRCRDIAMRQMVEARIPECGKFGEIAQDLDALYASLATVAAANDEGVAEAIDRQVRIAAWNAAKKSGASDALGYAVVEAVVAEFAAIRLLSQGEGA